MRAILDALEGIHSNKKKPLNITKELNKKPAVMKALSLEDATVDSNSNVAGYLDTIDEYVEMLFKSAKDKKETEIAYRIQNAVDDIRMRELNLQPSNIRAKYNPQVSEELEEGVNDVDKILQLTNELYNELVDFQNEETDENVEDLVGHLAEFKAKLEGDTGSFSEDKFDGYKIHRLGELQKKIDDVAKDIRLLGKTDSMPGATGAGDLTDQLTTMNDAIQMLQDVVERANSIVPDPLKNYDGTPKTEETVNEGGMKQAEIEVQDWVAKYENHTGVNGDELPKGYLQAMLNSGIMSDAYDQDEYMAFNKMNGYEDDGDWQEGDTEKFMASSPITGGMFNAINMIKTKYGIDDEMVNSIMGYFDEGKTINSEEQKMETTKKDTVEVAVEDLARVLELAGLKAEAEEKDFDFSKDNLELCDTCDKPIDKCDCEGHDHKAEELAPTQANNEVELDEYSNSPDEEYFDTDTQLNKMSGGLNGPKKQFKKEYPGDNPLAVDLQDKLAKMLSSM